VENTLQRKTSKDYYREYKKGIEVTAQSDDNDQTAATAPMIEDELSDESDDEDFDHIWNVDEAPTMFNKEKPDLVDKNQLPNKLKDKLCDSKAEDDWELINDVQ